MAADILTPMTGATPASLREQWLATRRHTCDQLCTANPACWAWPVQNLACTSPLPVLSDAALAMVLWHDGRCAICDHTRVLACDHDHQTGLVRGLLCRSCNIRESVRTCPVWGRYRTRNPAVILAVTQHYVPGITATMLRCLTQTTQQPGQGTPGTLTVNAHRVAPEQHAPRGEIAAR